MFGNLPRAPSIVPQFNVGCLLDIPTGRYHKGKDGESILNAGIGYVNSIAGPPNAYKSELVNYLYFTVLARYAGSSGIVYDTENSITYERLNRSARNHKGFENIDFADPEYSNVLAICRSGDILGDVLFEEIKKIGDDRVKNSKRHIKETPFISPDSKNVSGLAPFLVEIDSLTEFKVSSVQGSIVDKNSVGDSGANTLFMKEGAAKTQLITQLPNLAVRAGACFFLVAHIGQKIEIDKYAPQGPKLTHSKNGASTKGVPEKFKFINNILLEIRRAYIVVNSSSDKSSKYPKTDADRNINSDLMAIEFSITRNKSGASGYILTILVSQSEGILPTLTEFHSIKENNYGISGSNTAYVLDLRPTVSLSRTTVRGKLDDDPLLARACQITSELQQIQTMWRNLGEHCYITPKELYEKIEKLGYDWDILLDTRSYWIYEEDKAKHKPFLSTMDLLNMAAESYKPKWYKKQ